METLFFSETANGFSVISGTSTYSMHWVDGMLKVMGPDTCYFLLETIRGLEQATCALDSMKVVLGN